MKIKKDQLYTDEYFESGHIWLKIRQTVIAIVGWMLVFIPLLVTVMSVAGFYNHRIWQFWRSKTGILQVQFFALVLLFMFILTAIFTISMAIIQNRKRERLVEQWPTFDPIDQKKRKQELNTFMNQRFGAAEFREHVQTYQVRPNQNLATDEIQRVFKNHLSKVGKQTND